MGRRAAFAVTAPAKVNLILRVGPKQADGYHSVFSIVQQLSLGDRLRVTAHGRAIRLTSRGVAVPAGRANLIVQAAERLRRAAGVSAGATVELIKKIPIGAGLGGGSSDAAAAALALNRAWGLGWSRPRLAALLAPLGSDIALFFASPLALVEGTGERVRSLPHPLPAAWHFVVVYPGVVSSTGAAYRLLDRWRRERRRAARFPLTPREREIIIHRFLRENRRLGRAARLANDFEPVITATFPAVRDAGRLLADAGAVRVLLSGSGSAVFGLFSSARQARGAAAAVRRARPQWGAWAARPLRRAAPVRPVSAARSG
ncbi:MAG: 4-(cytidine 5'-diphospho)-2-C-methyl-D-erythritol kinase [Nitrospirota bacterium]